jgi:hypothetical protein
MYVAKDGSNGCVLYPMLADFACGVVECKSDTLRLSEDKFTILTFVSGCFFYGSCPCNLQNPVRREGEQQAPANAEGERRRSIAESRQWEFADDGLTNNR